MAVKVVPISDRKDVGKFWRLMTFIIEEIFIIVK